MTHTEAVAVAQADQEQAVEVLIDICPKCGEKDLTVWGTTSVRYSIENDKAGTGQDWMRDEVLDEGVDYDEVVCRWCGEIWPRERFTLNQGFLVELRDKPENGGGDGGSDN